MLTLRHWLAAHEAGHITYVEMHSSLTIYGYIDDSVNKDGIMELFDTLQSLNLKNSALEAPASGAAGEFAYYYDKVENIITFRDFALGVISRTNSDRELFYKNMDYNGLVNDGETDPKEIHFIKWAKKMVYDNYIIKNMKIFNSIRMHLYQRGFIGRSTLDAIKANRAPTESDINADYARIPKARRTNIRTLASDEM